MATQLKRGEPSIDRIEELLGADAKALLEYKSTAIPKENLNLPGPDFIDRVWAHSDRTPAVLRALQTLFDNGRLAGTGYLSILPVDQGIEHSAGASFAPNPEYFDPENIVKLAIEGGCNAVASTYGVLGTVGRKYAHKIPFIVKINHNELLTLPNKFDQVLFNQPDKSLKSASGSLKPMSLVWPASSGATCVIQSSKLPKAICTPQQI
jgi:class I fructose-bisphosphate aldolase